MSSDPKKETSLIDTAYAYYFHRTNRLLHLHFTKLMADHTTDLTVEQWFLLNRLSNGKSVSQTDLVDKTFKDRPNITRLLDGLEKKSLVARKDDPNDRRKFTVSITKAGKALLDKTIPVMLEARKAVYKGLKQEDLEALKAISEKIESNILQGWDWSESI
ncbi:MarR family transcriptional regulator [Leptospira semungkisensis]|uniref:MarR family transcriptional regulator n=1 Tax=Leptospira semungkisensis TaxID=2484985 RepID=A0A4R9G9B1_9LEPT|nr:MarR family transcriptional regulator [Leptospira semungkisensis]TGK07477.1 MarR family transcriptional regulator [Leptospira semungkisensis]